MIDENPEPLMPGESARFHGMAVERTENGEQYRASTASSETAVLSADQIEALAALCGRVSQPRPTVYLAYNGRAWGKAFDKLDAVAKFLDHHGDDNVPDPARVTIAEGRGDVWTVQRGTMISLRGDDIRRAVEHHIPRDRFTRLVELVQQDDANTEISRVLGDADSEELDVDG